MDSPNGRVTPPGDLQVVLPPEVARVVGRSRFPVVDLEIQPGWAEAHARTTDSQGRYRQDYSWDDLWTNHIYESVIVRMGEPLGEKLGYFGTYRGNGGSVGSLGGALHC